MHVPHFKNHIHPTIIEEDKVILSSEFGQQLLTGKSLVKVVEHLNGSNSVEEIINRLDGEVDPGQIYYVLSVLEHKKYVSEKENHLSLEQSAFWSSLGVTEVEVIKRKRASKIKIYSFGNCDDSFLTNEVNSMAFNIVQEDENFAIVLTDDYLQEGVVNRARILWNNNIPFTICKPNGIEMWLGPIFNPNKTACFDCLSQRMIANRDVEVYLKESGIISKPLVNLSGVRSSMQMSQNLLLTEVAKFIVMDKNDKLENNLLTFNYGNLESQINYVVKRPQCTTCGESKNQDLTRPLEKIVFKSSPKNFIDGGHRSVTAATTFQKFKHHISPITGIVNKMERITSEEDTLQHVFISGQNMAIKTSNFGSLRKNLRSNSCGKGITEIQAKVSAIGEAIERYSGVFRNEELKIRASFNELDGKAIHPNECMLFSENQYKLRDEINAKGSFFNVVPFELNKDEQIDWSPLWSISRNETVYLPTAYCYYSHPENNTYRFYSAPDSNGCAAGNTLEEATLQGFLELIERDSVCLWWYNRLSMPQLDLASFEDEYADNLVAYHKSRNRDLWVLDLTADTGIPSFIAISSRNDRMEFQDIVFAPAAHLNPKVALRRALTELNQMMPSMNDNLPLGEYNYDDPETVHWWRTCNLENQPYLLPDSQKSPTKMSDFKIPEFNDIKDDLEYCVDAVHKLDLEIHILDQTRPDIGLNVVKVVVPGLRHFWQREAKGRLYDVPVKMGWLTKPNEENELNPISIFI